MILKNPHEPFKSLTEGCRFGEPRNYGFHDGIDTNGPDGGNTDCNTPLLAIYDGKKIHSSSSDKGFGNIFVYEIVGPWGTRWIRYCHLQSYLIMPEGQMIKKAETTSYMGSTGNSTACHLHWSIFKKRPTNWRMIAPTKDMLNEYFEDPVEFYNKWGAAPEISMPKTYKGFDLTNQASVEAAFDLVHRVQHEGEELVKKEELEKLRKDAGEMIKLKERLSSIDKVHEQEIIQIKQKYQEDIKDETASLRGKVESLELEISELSRQLLESKSGLKERLGSRKFLLSSVTAFFDLIVAMAVLFGAKPDPLALGQVLTALHTAAAVFVVPEAISDHKERMILAHKIS